MNAKKNEIVKTSKTKEATDKEEKMNIKSPHSSDKKIAEEYAHTVWNAKEIGSSRK